MDFDDFETIYALGLDEVITGERAPTDEERMFLAAVGAGSPDFGGQESSGLLELWCLIVSLLGGSTK